MSIDKNNGGKTEKERESGMKKERKNVKDQ